MLSSEGMDNSLTHCISGNFQVAIQLPPHMCNHLQSSKADFIIFLVLLWDKKTKQKIKNGYIYTEEGLGVLLGH